MKTQTEKKKDLADLLGVTPNDLNKKLTPPLIKIDWHPTNFGALLIASAERALHVVDFADGVSLPRTLQRLKKTFDPENFGLGSYPPALEAERQLREFFDEKRQAFNLPIIMTGSSFQKKVLKILETIPFGERWSYGKVAEKAACASARATGQAIGSNPFVIIIPCHRVIGANNALTGYAGGLWRKKKLLALEEKTPPSCCRRLVDV